MKTDRYGRTFSFGQRVSPRNQPDEYYTVVAVRRHGVLLKHERTGQRKVIDLNIDWEIRP